MGKSKIIRIVSLFILIIILKSCQPTDEWTYEKLLALNPTHILNNKNVNSEIGELLKDNINYSEFKSEILIIIILKLDDEYEICLSRTDYNTFKSYRPDNFEEFMGYTIYQKKPVLLFGDIDATFFKKSKEEFYNVLGDMPEYDIDNPPIIYEPRMRCFQLK